MRRPIPQSFAAQIKAHCPAIRDPKKIYPYALRATAAIQFANAGLSAQALCGVMGWEDLRIAQHYITRSGRAAEREIEANKTEFVL